MCSSFSIRRLLTTKEDLGAESKGAVIDQYARKLLHSGYSREQTRKILKNGIKGYIGRNRKRAGKGLRSTAEESRRTRYVGKLLDKTGWYRKRNRKQEVDKRNSSGGNNATEGSRNKAEDEPEYKTVLFVEYTREGELAKRLRELTLRLSSVLGFKVKVVERTGTTLKNMFPTTNLWEGQGCGRGE